jgi:hypothetical protein
MVLPRNLAFDEVIDEAWTDAVVDNLTDLVPSVGGVVYGVTHYRANYPGGGIAVPYPTPFNVATVSIAPCPAGSILDISWHARFEVGSVGAAYAISDVVLNGSALAEQTALGMSAVFSGVQSMRLCNVPAPVTAGPFDVILRCYKTANVGVATLYGTSTINVVSYRP